MKLCKLGSELAFEIFLNLTTHLAPNVMIDIKFSQVSLPPNLLCKLSIELICENIYITYINMCDVYLYAYIFVYMIPIYLYVYIFVSMYLYVYICTHVSVYICMYIYLYI